MVEQRFRKPVDSPEAADGSEAKPVNAGERVWHPDPAVDALLDHIDRAFVGLRSRTKGDKIHPELKRLAQEVCTAGAAQPPAASPVDGGNEPMRCQCTHEQGDSDCPLHVVCSECGADISHQTVVKERARLAAEVERLRDDLERDSLHRDCRRENAELRAETGRANDEVRRLRETVAGVNSRYDLQFSANEVEQVFHALDASEAEVRRLRELCQGHMLRASRLEDERNAFCDAGHAAELRIVELRQENERLTQQVNDLNEQLHSMIEQAQRETVAETKG